jgi:hypothetical protein
MPDDPSYTNARLSEFEIVPGYLARKDEESRSVAVRVFDASNYGTGQVRISIESSDQAVAEQLIVDGEALAGRLHAPQGLD